MLRVAIADDHESVRQGLRWMLHGDPSIEVVAEAEDGEQLLAMLQRIDCDVVLLDLSMPVLDGLGVLRRLAVGERAVPAVVLTMHDDASHVDRALALGASGYILKSASLAEMVGALRAAVEGGAYVQPSLVKPLLERRPATGAPAGGGEAIQLTPRQVELLRALASGRGNKELAHDLGLSEATVKGYLKELYARIGVTSRAAAVAYGMRSGLIR